MATSKDKMVADTPDLAAKRKIRERERRVAAMAIDILDNDPEVDTMREARKKAREILETESSFRKGTLERGRAPRRIPQGRRHRSSRQRSQGRKRVRRVARAVSAPFGSAASAGWTFLSGAVGLLFLYVLLQEAGAVSAFSRAVGSGLRRFGDPFTPLFPRADEQIASPRVRRRQVATRKAGGGGGIARPV